MWCLPHTMQRYLQNSLLEQRGQRHFDCWAATYGESVAALELAPEGTGYRMKTRFAKFNNVPEMVTAFRECADIQTADMLKLPVPETVYQTEVTKPTSYQQEMVKGFGERAEEIRKGNVDPRDDNMLKITNDGRKLALDQRLVNFLLPDTPESKVNRCTENIFQIWQDTAEKKSAQLVFCDLSTPKQEKTAGISKKETADISEKAEYVFTDVYNDLFYKLKNMGIPEQEIAFIHDANTEAKKNELFAKVRRGEVRVLIGSTFKMGAGTNVQNKLIALHHLDVPWRPAENLTMPESKTRRGRVGKGIANTLDTSCNQGVVVPVSYGGTESNVTEQNTYVAVMLSDGSPVCAIWNEEYDCYIAIRKLTPKECFRLQGWEDVYFERAALVNSNRQLYKQAGNGVTVPVVRAISKKM